MGYIETNLNRRDKRRFTIPADDLEAAQTRLQRETGGTVAKTDVVRHALNSVARRPDDAETRMRDPVYQSAVFGGRPTSDVDPRVDEGTYRSVREKAPGTFVNADVALRIHKYAVGSTSTFDFSGYAPRIDQTELGLRERNGKRREKLEEGA